jgi:hypothetical protein
MEGKPWDRAAGSLNHRREKCDLPKRRKAYASKPRSSRMDRSGKRDCGEPDKMRSALI